MARALTIIERPKSDRLCKSDRSIKDYSTIPETEATSGSAILGNKNPLA
ncbi:hypothetical protein Ple7327_0542 [Pleurocapsa sp. PCC 7327]|nr:hypothetical protein Ple7327_0542 [Pleurocapsa sp. PCC 7327]